MYETSTGLLADLNKKNLHTIANYRQLLKNYSLNEDSRGRIQKLYIAIHVLAARAIDTVVENMSR